MMSGSRTLTEWLAHCERLHPATIDLSLERVRLMRERLALAFAAPVFTVAGTNGKGSTCAMLEAILRQAGYRVGVYTSPHLVRFEERCRVDARTVDAADLVPHFEAVEAVRGELSLTYFEFTTLAILRLLSQARLDAVVLEVGLGGRLDAVNVIDADCALITSIALDHMDYLGADREAIGREKAGVLRAGRAAIVADPQPPASVIGVARAIGADLRCLGRDYTFLGDSRQWSWRGRRKRFDALAYPALRGTNQLLNAAGVLAALEALQDRLPVAAQAVRAGLAAVELPGRLQIVAGQPVLVLDVAHNPHAVAALAHDLDRMGFFPRTHAVFGAMADKDIEGVLRPMLPLVDVWHLTDLPTARAASARALEQVLHRLSGEPMPASQCHAGARWALQAAVAAADPADRIVVFGSFYTVGGILEHGVPRLGAGHSS